MILLVSVTAAAVADVRLRRIPNLLTLPALVLGLLLWVPDATPGRYGAVLALTVVVFFAGLLLFAAGVLGGGDGKLLSAVAALGGTRFFAEFLVWTCIVGVAVSLVVLAANRALFPLAGRLARGAVNILRFGDPLETVVEGEGHKMPYAVIIAAAAWATVAARLAGLLFFS